MAKWQMYTTSSRSLKSGARFYNPPPESPAPWGWMKQSVGMLGKHVLGAIKVATKRNTAGNPSCYGKTGSVINFPLHFLYIKWIKCKPDENVSLQQVFLKGGVVGILHDSSCTQIFVIMWMYILREQKGHGGSCSNTYMLLQLKVS